MATVTHAFRVVLVGIVSLTLGIAWAQHTRAAAELDRVTKRVQEIRSAGSAVDSINVLRDPVKISRDDYRIMVADIYCAIRNHPGVPNEKREELRWFAAAPGLDIAFPNRHATIDRGREITESFLASRPRQIYQAPAAEVAWFSIRIKELSGTVPNEEAEAILNKEAKLKPWSK